MIEKILSLGRWARHRENMLCLICIVVALTLFFSVFFFTIWLSAFLGNGLGYTKFELGSAWQGLAALGTFLTVLFGLILKSNDLEKSKLEEYKIDSIENSVKGEKPKRGESI